MSKVASALGGALSGLKKPEARLEVAAPPVAPPSPLSADDAPPVGVVIRFSPRDHETVTRYADDLGMSIQQLVETSINEMRARQGLAPIQGRPRSKTRRRR